MNKIFIAPHNDDEALFGAFTIQRERPLVLIVTDGEIHRQRYGIAIETRRAESVEACKILEAPVAFLGFKDSELKDQEFELWDQLRYFKPEKVWAPAPLENGNPDHNLIGKVCLELWGKAANTEREKRGEKPVELILYDTYRRDSLEPRGDVEIRPTEEEIAVKHSALALYKSQMQVNRPHFDAVIGKSEFYVTHS